MALIQWGRQMRAGTRMPLLKRLFWIYFLLLIFEGALRKWFLPQYSAPLLLVRDPIALFIIWEAYRTHRWPKQWSGIIGVLTAGLLALAFLQMIAGENPWFVAVYGLRSYLLPFPVAFIMGANLDEEDLRKFGVCILWLVVPMTLLAAAQYQAGPASILNAGAYSGGQQLGYSGGHVRASGTFSYVTGPGSFYPLAAAFIFYGIVNERFAKRWLLWVASCGLILAIPLIGSRGMLVTLLAILVFVFVAALSGLSQLASSVKVIVALLIVSVLTSKLPIFSEASSTFQDRLSQAGGSAGQTGGIVSRLIDSITPNYSGTSTAWYGNGIGLGSNVASTLLTGGQVFLAGEGEYARTMFEFGPVFGSTFLLFRFLLAVMISVKAYSLVRENKPLAWFLVPLLFTGVTNGVLEQPTIQGFTVITLGFSLAALNRGIVQRHTLPIQDPRLVRPRINLRART